MIACIGWGSLVWCPQSLHVRSCWFSDGPLLSVEFARESKDKRITLVIAPNTPPLRCLWALMSLTDLDAAKTDLAAREGIDEEKIAKCIGVVTAQSNPQNGAEAEVKRWLSVAGVEAAIWTSLRPKIRNEYRKPTIDEVLAHLRGELTHEQRVNAEEYIRKTPRQIDTDYRRRIELEFGWLPIS